MLRSCQLAHYALHAFESLLNALELLLERAFVLRGGFEGILKLLTLVTGFQRLLALLQVLAARLKLRAGLRSEERRRRERQILPQRGDEPLAIRLGLMSKEGRSACGFLFVSDELRVPLQLVAFAVGDEAEHGPHEEPALLNIERRGFGPTSTVAPHQEVGEAAVLIANEPRQHVRPADGFLLVR